MNVANAMRLALTTYDACLYSDILNSSNNPHTTIYSIGGNAPNVKNNVYNFGGINTEYNLAVDLYNQRSENKISIPKMKEMILIMIQLKLFLQMMVYIQV